jgi:hypothetical protein
VGQSGRAIELYSCFISYSTKDQAFCQRLHNDLQAAGVRCSFAPEDLKIGDKLRDTIETAIRLHDKLLLVLSDNSIASSWVEAEVESALEREERRAGWCCFPSGWMNQLWTLLAHRLPIFAAVVTSAISQTGRTTTAISERSSACSEISELLERDAAPTRSGWWSAERW